MKKLNLLLTCTCALFALSVQGQKQLLLSSPDGKLKSTYRIFQEYATFMIAEARKRRIERIFELDGHVYAFDSTTIDPVSYTHLDVYKRQA